MDPQAAFPRGYIKIRDRAEEDRPREKLLAQGSGALSHAELLAILIGSGVQYMSALDLAHHILKACEYDLAQLSRCSVAQLQAFKGIGEARAVAIVSAMELASRCRHPMRILKPRVTNAEEAYELMKPELLHKKVEECWAILLNNSKRLIKKCRISIGGITRTVVDPKVVFKHAIEHQASSLILVHNHPSGNTSPSMADFNLTERLVQGGKLLSIEVLDHLIFADQNFFSFAQEKVLLKPVASF